MSLLKLGLQFASGQEFLKTMSIHYFSIAHLAAALLVLTSLFSPAPADPSEEPLSPADSATMFHVAEDLVWEQILAEPTVAQPLHLNFDERGRLWVVQYRQYPYPEGLKVLSRDNFWRVQYDKVPAAPPNHIHGRDKITIHEDTDGDGSYDKHKTFLDGLNLTTAVEFGRGGVWVLNPPYLLFYPDKNLDDVPDGPPEVHLSGFGLSDSHSVVNSLCWGPDGWLYAAQGSTVHGQVTTSDTGQKPVHSLGQLIWRYHPEQRKYEIFAEGGGNAFGVEIDSKGRIFSGHNGGNTRGFHYVQGGYYRKGFSKHGPLSNPYAFGFFNHMPHHDVPRFTHTFVIYEGATLPESYHGRLLGVEPMQNQIVFSDVLPHGSSLKTTDISRPVTSDDQWFRPVDVKTGPDGAVYVADFYERYPSHRQHYDGLVFSENGRVYRLRAASSPPTPSRNLGKLASDELVQLASHPNKWVRRTALRLLGDRKDKSLLGPLRAMLADHDGQVALEALWMLNLSGGLDEATALKSLQHRDPHVRIWTVRLLGDQREVSATVAEQFQTLSRTEPNVEVRSQLACTARRLNVTHTLAMAGQLFQHDDDKDDVYQPLLLWWALETHCDQHPERVLELFNNTDLWERPLVTTHIVHRLMRRFAATGNREDLLFCSALFELAPNNDLRQRLLVGFEEAFQGRSLANLPDRLVQQIRDLGGGSLALRVRGGDTAALAEAIQLVSNPEGDPKLQLELIEVWGEAKHEAVIAPLLDVVANSTQPGLRSAALATLQNYNLPSLATRVLDIYLNGVPDEVATAALTTLASRPLWARSLLEAVDENKIEPPAIDESTLRKILLHDDQENGELVRKHWGTITGTTTEEMRNHVKQLTTAIRSGSGDPYAGKKHYNKTCAKCHRLFEEGADIGPNLTSYQRDNLESMLLNVVNPSAEIREGFGTYNVFTADGRVLSGFLADQDKQLIVLRTADGQRQFLQRDQIEEMKPSPRSIMPEKLLDSLNDQQVRDLFAYLRSRQPLND